MQRKQGTRAIGTARRNFETHPPSNYKELSTHRREEFPRRSQDGNPSRYSTERHLSGSLNQRLSRNEGQIRDRPRQRQEWQPREYRMRELSRDISNKSSEMCRGGSHREASPNDRYAQRERSREESMRTPNLPITSPQEITSSSRNKTQPSERGDPLLMCDPLIQPEEVETAMGIIKESMTLYTKCADPLESAARRERLKRAEEQGIIEKNATKMVLSAIVRESTNEALQDRDMEVQGSQERTPMSERLGPLNGSPSPQERLPLSAKLGPINGVMSGSPLASTADIATAERIPISERLGPVTLSHDAGTSNTKPSLVKKRKPGRPPGIKKAPTGSEQAPAQATTSRKRKAPQDKPPLGKKKTGSEAVKPRRIIFR
ncbi:Clat_adaptor_s domain-containing protein [Raphanus sativus]|nr:Clat_adaptor_s domain-containing protein [Raphanus sativus]